MLCFPFLSTVFLSRIDSYGVIKVGDFFMRATGGVHDTGRSPASVTVSEEKVPIKWMAPESIEDDVYTEATDVVSTVY